MSKGMSTQKRGKKSSISSLSSIKLDTSEQKIRLEGNDFADFDDLDIEMLRLDGMYKTRQTQELSAHQRDAACNAEEVIRKILSNVVITAQENQINKLIPKHSVVFSYQIVEKAMTPLYIYPDDSKLDFLTPGLVEDTEPHGIFQDAWLRAKIHVDTYQKEEDQVFNLPEPKSIPMDLQSRRSKASSSTHYPKRALGESGIHEKKMQPLIPAPIDLAEQLNVSITEENLRQKKENERREKEDKIIQDTLKRQNMLHEEQQKFNKFQKENKTAGFTYDYNGELIPVQKVKLNKLPPPAQTIHYGFKQEEDAAAKETKKKKPNKTAETVSKFKKVPEQEKEFARMVSNQPPILDNIPLTSGVALTFDGRKRIGPRPNTVEMASLTLTGASKVRLGRKQYDELVKHGGFNRGKIEQHDQQNRMLYSAGDPRYENSPEQDQKDLNTLERMKFIQKMQNQESGVLDKKGGIKIQSAKIYETFAQTIDENEEVELKRLIAIEQRKKEAKIAAAQLNGLTKSPIDEFNLQITKQTEWGKSHYGTGTFGTLNQYSMKRPNEKDMLESLGKKVKPRERLKNEFFSSTLGNSTMDLRASTSEGFFRKNLKTSEGTRDQQMRLNTGGGNSNNPSTINNNIISNNSNSMGTSGGGSGAGIGKK